MANATIVPFNNGLTYHKPEVAITPRFRVEIKLTRSWLVLLVQLSLLCFNLMHLDVYMYFVLAHAYLDYPIWR